MIGRIRAENLNAGVGKMNALKLLKKHGRKIREKYGVRKIGIFGSFARGDEKGGSDIDVLVEFEPGYETFDNYMELKFFLEELFGVKVDLVTLDSLRPQIKKAVLKEVSYA
jgi:hypothetical protein